MDLPKNLKLTRNGVDKLRQGMQQLQASEVMVGFPEDTSARTIEKGEKDITNAALAYIHDKGDSEANIPRREFMRPGMESAKDQVTATLTATAARLLRRPSKLVVQQGLMQVGIQVQVAIKKEINKGVPPPLSEATLLKRAAKGRKGAAKELERRAQGLPPSTQFAKPLIDTGQLRNAVNFVIRPRRR